LVILVLAIVSLCILSNDDDVLMMSLWSTMYTMCLVGGMILTSIIYWEFRNPAGRISYLTLPASHLEKVVSRGLYTLVIFPLAITAMFFCIFKIVELLDGPAYKDVFISELLPTIIQLYLIAHAIVYMFAIWINKYVAPKTALIALVTFIGFVFLGALIFRIVFDAQFDGLEMSGQFRMTPKEGFQERHMEFWYPLLQNVILYGTLLLFWPVAYFKMKEKEV